MNKVSLFTRSLIVTTILFSVGKIQSMQKFMFHDQNGVFSSRGIQSEMVDARHAATLLASMAGCPNWAVATVAAAGEGCRQFMLDPKRRIEQKGSLIKGVGLYAVIDAAKRYAVNFACDQASSYISMPNFIAQKFAYLSQPAQGAVVGFMSYLTTRAHDLFTRACLSAWYDPSRSNDKIKRC